MTVFAPSHEMSELDPDKRVRYSLGMIVGDDELRQDQRYLMARDERHQRALHGWGVVAGLELVIADEAHVEVHPGAALDAQGRWIGIDVTQCADLLPWLAAHREELPALPADVPVWITLCYDECATDLIPVPSGPCRTLDNSVQPSRVKDSFQLGFTLEEPPVRGDLDEFPEAGVMTVLLDEDADLATKRSALSDFVSSRGDPGGFANPTLDALEPGCVVLGRVDVPLAVVEEELVLGSDVEASWLTFSDRPLVLSTQFIQEWLLRVEGGGTVVIPPDPDPFFTLDELTDVNAPTAREGNVVIGTVRPDEVGTGIGTDAPPPNPRWEERLLNLDLLADVQIPANFGATSSDIGLVLKFDGRVWRPQTDDVGTVTPEIQPHVRCRPTPYAIVAGGVLDLHLNSDGFLEEVTQRTRYGGLEAEILARGRVGSLLHLRFHGYRETREAFRELFGRQFVVKLTPEAGGALLRTQVVHMGDEGVVVFVGQLLERDVEEYRNMVVEHLGDDVLAISALHVEISAFDDREAGNETLDKVPQLTEDL
ncbi:hypothetical protein [Nocardioides gilvus]|uniref:hypothetical protein n=1 Tax=Nocardioides gilvus TaxID=1735589 RepID=UPI000D743EDD|nr:hypothetical protein [Nocardioides gilvus]